MAREGASRAPGAAVQIPPPPGRPPPSMASVAGMCLGGLKAREPECSGLYDYDFVGSFYRFFTLTLQSMCILVIRSGLLFGMLRLSQPRPDSRYNSLMLGRGRQSGRGSTRKFSVLSEQHCQSPDTGLRSRRVWTSEAFAEAGKYELYFMEFLVVRA